MARRSSITQLDAPIQAEVQRLVREGWTIDDIVAELAKLGAKVSRSAVGRYVQHARKTMEAYTQAQEVSRVWLDKLESEPNGDVARLLPEMLRALAFKTVEQMAGESEDGTVEPIKPMDVMLLAKAVKDLGGASKDMFAIAKLRSDAADKARRELLAEQSVKLDTMAKANGVTDATLALIREKLGITA